MYDYNIYIYYFYFFGNTTLLVKIVTSALPVGNGRQTFPPWGPTLGSPTLSIFVFCAIPNRGVEREGDLHLCSADSRAYI